MSAPRLDAVTELECVLWLVLAVSLIVLIMIGLRMRALSRAPDISPAPTQIQLELAATPARARALLHSWQDQGRTSVRRQIVLDFPFIVAYIVGGAASALLAGQVLGPHWPSTGAASAVVAWTWVLAGLLDVAENAALLLVLREKDDLIWLQPFASAVAGIKWLFAAAGVLYVLAAIPYGMYHVGSRLWALLEPLWDAISLCGC